MTRYFPEKDAREFASDLYTHADELGINPKNERITIYPRNSVVPPALGGSSSSFGILNDPRYTPMQSGGMGGVTMNRRDLSSMSMAPSMSPMIGANELLIRMGSAGLGQVGKGGSAQMSAIGNAYADVQEANRQETLQIYQDQMANLGNANKEAPEDDSEQIGNIDNSLFKMDEALAFLSDPNASVTGPFDTYVAGLWDKLTGGDDQSRRMLLAELRVDDALLRIAQTKGAISNKEMDLFLEPAPAMGSQERVWIAWIQRRQRALRNVRNRLTGGQRVSDPASETQVNQYISTPVGANTASMSEADAIVGITN